MVSRDIIRLDYSQFHEFHRIKEFEKRFEYKPRKPKEKPYAKIQSKWMQSLTNMNCDVIKKTLKAHGKLSPEKQAIGAIGSLLGGLGISALGGLGNSALGGLGISALGSSASIEKKKDSATNNTKDSLIMIDENPTKKVSSIFLPNVQNKNKEPNVDKNMLDKYYGGNMSDINVSAFDSSVVQTFDSKVNTKSNFYSRGNPSANK